MCNVLINYCQLRSFIQMLIRNQPIKHCLNQSHDCHFSKFNERTLSQCRWGNEIIVHKGVNVIQYQFKLLYGQFFLQFLMFPPRFPTLIFPRQRQQNIDPQNAFPP